MMSKNFTEKELKTLKKFERGNRFLFISGSIIILFILGIWMFVSMNPKESQFLIESTWPKINIADYKLLNMAPHTDMEEFLLSSLKEIIPLPILMVKVVAIGSLLTWFFCLGIMCVGFARYQKRMIDFFKKTIDKD